MANYVFDPTSLEENHVLTSFIKRQLPVSNSLAMQIAPLHATIDRKVKVNVQEVSPASKGQFKSITSNTPITSGGATLSTHYMELVDLSEKEVLGVDDLIKLYSADRRAALHSAYGILDVGKRLANRNQTLTEWMAWEAFKDELVVSYPEDDTELSVDFDLDNTDALMSASHKPDISSSDPWDVASADIIGQVRTWIDLLGTDSGMDGKILMMNKTTWRYVQANTALKAFLTEANFPIKWVSTGVGAALFWDLDLNTPAASGTGRIIIDDSFWQDTDKSRTRFIPDGYILMTTEWQVNGGPIAMMFDGPVVQVQGNDLVVANNPGLSADIYINAEQMAKNIRVSTARLPWIQREHFLYAQVY